MAIDAKELRIGNLILAGNMNEVNFGKGPYKQEVRQVSLITLDVDDEYMEYVGHVEPGKSTKEMDDLCRNVNGIPITVEWLFRLGFIGSDVGIDEIIYYCPFLGAVVRHYGGEFIFHYGTEDLMAVEFIHQLQNIHYMVTGLELVIDK